MKIGLQQCFHYLWAVQPYSDVDVNGLLMSGDGLRVASHDIGIKRLEAGRKRIWIAVIRSML